jgi:hypothetical protein
MPVFFDGQLLISPTTRSVVNDSALYNKNLTVSNVAALVGRSVGGKPNSVLRFGNPSEAQAALVDGELLTAILKAFDPSSQTGSPQEVVAVRVNPAQQASLALLDATPVTVINLVSTDYGLYTNQIKVKIEAASTAGKKLTTQFGNSYYTQDNVSRNAFKIRYTGGQASARMSITGTQITLEAPNSSVVATIDLSVYDTIQEVVDRINVVSGFTASVQDGNGTKPALQGLDFVSNQDVKTADYIATAHLQAIVDWFNSTSEGFVTATRVANVGTLPANIGFTYLTGGSDGTVTNNEWSSAFTTLQTADVQWITPVSSDPSIHAMADTHCAFMSTQGRMERRAVCGMASGSTDQNAIDAAKAINSDRTSLVHIGYYDYDANGTLVLQPPYMTAALISGMASGVNPGTPLTNKSMKVRGLERKLRNPTDTDVLIKAGVLCVEDTPQGFKVVKSNTTWLTNLNYNRVEMSVGAALDFIARNVRNALDVLRGEKANAITLNRAVSITESTLRELARAEPQGPGVLAGDADSPAYKAITASIDGDVLRVQFQCSPVLPTNYVLVSIFAVPFSGTATAA